MSKKIVSMLLIAAMGMTMLVGCGGSGAADTSSTAGDTTSPETTQSTESADTANASSGVTYSGDLSIMHFSTSEESQGNGGSDGFRTMIAQWKEANPNVNLVENV